MEGTPDVGQAPAQEEDLSFFWASAVSVESLPLAAQGPEQSLAALEALVARCRPLEQLGPQASVCPRRQTGHSLQLALFARDSEAPPGPRIVDHDHDGCLT